MLIGTHTHKTENPPIRRTLSHPSECVLPFAGGSSLYARACVCVSVSLICRLCDVLTRLSHKFALFVEIIRRCHGMFAIRLGKIEFSCAMPATDCFAWNDFYSLRL